MMGIADKIQLRKRVLIETVNDGWPFIHLVLLYGL